MCTFIFHINFSINFSSSIKKFSNIFIRIVLYLLCNLDRTDIIMILRQPGGSDSKESACSARDPGSVPGLGRTPGEGNGYPFQYSGLENSMDCRIHGVTKSQT